MTEDPDALATKDEASCQTENKDSWRDQYIPPTRLRLAVPIRRTAPSAVRNRALFAEEGGSEAASQKW